MHTDGSDGAWPASEVLKRYRELGYDFVAVTDHQKVTRCEGPEGMLVIPGVELHYPDVSTGKQWHFVGVGFEDEARICGSPEEIVKFLRPRSEYLVMAHPYWSNLSGEDVRRFPQCDAVEVFNTLAMGEIGRGHSEPAWDHFLSSGAHLNCVAVDDTHQRKRYRDLGVSWVMVKAAELSRKAILEALKRGEYYSSTGPEILDWTQEEMNFAVRTSPCRSIAFVCNTWFGGRSEAPTGESISEADYTMRGPEKYMRVQVTDERGGRAWTNPVYF